VHLFFIHPFQAEVAEKRSQKLKKVYIFCRVEILELISINEDDTESVTLKVPIQMSRLLF